MTEVIVQYWHDRHIEYSFNKTRSYTFEGTQKHMFLCIHVNSNFKAYVHCA